MYVVTLNSSLSISKAFNFHPNSNKKHPRPRAVRATKEYENLYKILSLSPNNKATTDDIKKAYRSMALRYHPDVCHKEESTRIFVQLNQAYRTLSNPRLREEYDYQLGLRNKKSVADESWRHIWQDQVAELKRRSHTRMEQKQGSSWPWTSTM